MHSAVLDGQSKGCCCSRCGPNLTFGVVTLDGTRHTLDAAMDLPWLYQCDRNKLALVHVLLQAGESRVQLLVARSKERTSGRLASLAKNILLGVKLHNRVLDSPQGIDSLLPGSLDI
jgi:hypothetical protein